MSDKSFTMSETLDERAQQCLAAIRAGEDTAGELLDAMYPSDFQRFTHQHATQVDVSVLAAQWFADQGATHVLDVGAGAGRMCIVGAATTAIQFTGIERRVWLVEAAREAARALGVSTARFLCGDVRDVRWSDYDGFYLFNPFAENYLDEAECIDLEWSRDQTNFDADVGFAESQLAIAPRGTIVITWNGFGGLLEGYTHVRRQWMGHVVLDCLRKIA
jgi:SAM-dependent methyltransferase